MNFKTIYGFTLIELMVVMVIISVILTFVSLSIGDGGISRTLELEGKRFSSLVTLAREESIMQAKEMGISFEDNSYQFYVLEGQEWHPQTARDDIFRHRILPPAIQIELQIEGMPVDKDAMPQLLILSSGELTPFEVIFSAEEADAYHVTGTALGEIHASY